MSSRRCTRWRWHKSATDRSDEPRPCRACLERWLWPAWPSTQAVASQRPVIMGHPLLFGCLAQQSLGALSWCLDTTWEPGWQPNCHQPLKRDSVWRQARPPKHQVTSQYDTHKIKTNNLSHIFIYDFIITFIKSYNCSHNYNIISSSSQLQIASEKYLYYNE
jgi:hypothetical protein